MQNDVKRGAICPLSKTQFLVLQVLRIALLYFSVPVLRRLLNNITLKLELAEVNPHSQQKKKKKEVRAIKETNRPPACCHAPPAEASPAAAEVNIHGDV